MPPDLTLLEQLEQWFDAQVPDNLHDLPFKMLESVERISNELCESARDRDRLSETIQGLSDGLACDCRYVAEVRFEKVGASARPFAIVAGPSVNGFLPLRTTGGPRDIILFTS